jgi:predicted transcriptional regulator
LEEKVLITYRKDGNLKIYFISGKLSVEEKNLTTLHQQEQFQDIILPLIDTLGSTASHMADKISLKPPTISKYISILEDRGVLRHEKVGRERKILYSQ